ncbi:antichymotrypsin-2-like isoform X1 [Plodia interpunctella]|uniref:antichymotrypsin-2-like isoform X1 n=1 Tax=Plodia interpunctella TaxID=58824 RepID=UPI0023679266|nr:antichymotrypsin-2-like isoform X1 [Plodia interpunctella]
MTIMLLSSKVLKICLIMSLILSATSNKDDTLESKSIDSTGDSLEDKSSHGSRLELDLTGTLRQTFVYHMGLMDTRTSAVCSPISALLPLGKLAMGSSSRRYEEFKQAVGYRRSKVVSKFTAVMSKLNHISGRVQLTIASRLYVSKDYSLRSSFHERVRHIFKSSCERVDFRNGVETAKSINRWIHSETDGVIKDLIKPGEIDKETSLLITNAIYFNGRWKDKFNDIHDAVFYTPSRDKLVKLMSRIGDYNYVKSDKLHAEIVEIPYSGNDVSFIAVLPNERQGLASVLRSLMDSPKRLNEEMSKMRQQRMSVSIPRFKIKSDLDLAALYYKIGMKDIFKKDNKVLTKVLKNHRVHVSRAVHAAVIEVDQYGTEGASVSAVQATVVSATYVERRFRADHPFLFFVIANDEQLFGGIYTGE